MNLKKKNNKIIVSCVTLFIFILAQVLIVGPVKAQTVSKASITLNKTIDKVSARVGDEITLSYNIQPNDISTTLSNTQDKEIVMIMDTSGSMDEYLGNSSRLDVAKSAAKRFIDKFSTDGKAKIGLVQYSNYAITKSGLVGNGSFSTLKNNIDDFWANGGTNTGDGLRLAHYMLKQSSNPNAKKYIVLFTDGEPTFYSYVWNYSTRNYDFYTGNGSYPDYSTNGSNDYNNGLIYANKIAAMIPDNSNVNSFMIGCTMSNYGKNTLQEIAGKAKGNYSFAQTASDIDDVYSQIADKIKNELPVNSLKFEETLPSGIQVQQVPAGFTVSGQTITGNLGNMVYKYSGSTKKYTASPINFEIKAKIVQSGSYSLSKDANGVSNSFISYKDLDNTDGKLFFPVKDINIANGNASIKLGKTVDKTNIIANSPFNLNYTIQPDKIPVGDVDPSYEKGSDIVLVMDTSGSMKDTLEYSKSKMKVAKDTATDFINKFKGDSSINIALVEYNSKGNLVYLKDKYYKDIVFSNLADNNEFNSLNSAINSLQPNGGTNIGDGLRLGYHVLKSQGDTGRKKYIVLMTDGMPTAFTSNSSALQYTRGYYSYEVNGEILNQYGDSLNYFNTINAYEYKIDSNNSNARYVVNGGNNDYKQLSLNYAYNISDIIKSDANLSAKPIMIAFSRDSDVSKLSQIAGRAGGEYKKALSEEDMKSVYDSIATQVQSDFTISGVKFEETFPKGINLEKAVLPEGFTKIKQQDGSWKVTGVLSSISYKLDSTGKFYEPLPVTGFSIENLSGAAAQYVLGSGKTSFISYKDINGSITNNYFPETNINIFPNTPADISASLVQKDGQSDLYTLTINSNTGASNRITSFNVGGTEKNNNLWSDYSGLTSTNSSKQKDLSKNDLEGNNSLCIKATDQNGNSINETVSLITITDVKLSDIEQNIKVRPGDITFTTEPNATITSIKVNGETIAVNQSTGADGKYTALGVNLKDGDNVIQVNITNKFNNTTNMTLHKTIDATPPAITGNYTYSNKKIDATFSENVNLVWLECDLNNDGTISSEEKVTVSTENVTELKDIQVTDNFQGKNVVIKARDLSGNIGSAVPVDKTPPEVQAVYIDNTYKTIDVTVDELVNLIWLECDVNKDGVISDNEKVTILSTTGNEVRGVQIPDAFYGKNITIKAKDLSGNEGSTVLKELIVSNVVKKGIFANGKLLDNVPINIVRSLDVNVGIGVKAVFNGQDIILQINKNRDSVSIVGNTFDLYEITNESTFTIKKVGDSIKAKNVVQNGEQQEFTIPTNTLSTGYKYYLFVFKMKVDRNSSIGTVEGNTIKVNSQVLPDKDGKPFKFDFNIVDLPPVQ